MNVATLYPVFFFVSFFLNALKNNHTLQFSVSALIASCQLDGANWSPLCPCISWTPTLAHLHINYYLVFTCGAVLNVQE